jgi:hypothetical protein
MNGRGQQNLIVVLDGEGLEGLNDLRKERVAPGKRFPRRGIQPSEHQVGSEHKPDSEKVLSIAILKSMRISDSLDGAVRTR